MHEARMTRDDDSPAPAQLGPLDKTFRDTNMVVLILFGVCCGFIALILGAIGFFTAKDPKAKSNAMIVMIIGGIGMAVGVAVQVLGIAAGAAGAGK
jgi:uncharacterized membrane protein